MISYHNFRQIDDENSDSVVSGCRGRGRAKNKQLEGTAGSQEAGEQASRGSQEEEEPMLVLLLTQLLVLLLVGELATTWLPLTVTNKISSLGRY